MTTRRMYRQGDVLLVERVGAVHDLTPMSRDEHGRIVLAHGERTGHAHVFKEPGVSSFSLDDTPDDPYVVEIGGGGATLRHELVSGRRAEHDDIVIPGGLYDSPVQVEYAPAAIAKVTD